MSQPIIHVLDDNTANKIAAGEVVERPASVIKELVENSIDAQSHTVEIEIADGGVSFIRVTDDGIGMNVEDAQIAVLRHATSKIRLVDDLESISSLGFRGEALPSIAAVSKFTLTTRLHEETLASYVEIHGGTVIDRREAGGNAGTTITVTDLFYNVPARRKFLKTASAESSHIHDVISKLALSHPDIAFKLINNQRLVLSTPGNSQLLDTLTNLYGQKIAPDVMPIDYTAEDIRITGYLSKPTLLKSSRHWQSIIVNLRIINSRSIAKALDNAYHSLLPKSGYPLAVLNITVPLDTVDVNVHPQKSEVKFSDEQKIFRSVYKAVTSVLSATHTPIQLAATFQAKRVAIPPDRVVDQPVITSQTTNSGQYYSKPSEQPVKMLWQEEDLPFTSAQANIKQQDTLSGINEQFVEDECPVQMESAFFLRPLGQVEDCYIVAQGEDGLYIIDQHAAHERILYDRMSQATTRIPAQQLLVPLFFEFDVTESTLITEYQTIFYQLGFTVELVGPQTIRLLELPVDIVPAQAENLLREILQLIQNMHQPTPADLRHACLQMAACRAAIKAGDTLNMRQIQALLSELCATALPYTCPHGRPAMIRLSPSELAKMFKRT